MLILYSRGFNFAVNIGFVDVPTLRRGCRASLRIDIEIYGGVGTGIVVLVKWKLMVL